MRNISGLFVLVVALIVNVCTGKSVNQVAESDDVNSTSLTPKEYVENNTFIDIDAKALADINFTRDYRSYVNPDDMAKMKAALYRFFKNVRLENGIYICDVEDGKSINISESLFVSLKENLEQMNDEIKETREKGIEVVQSKPDSAYLNSLLN